MLFSSNPCHRLEPVSEMSRAFFNRPVLHRNRNGIGDIDVQVCAFFNRFLKFVVYILRQFFTHNLVIENIAPENARYIVHINHPFNIKK